jgi:cell division protein FtsW (lipid II flippase)
MGLLWFVLPPVLMYPIRFILPPKLRVSPYLPFLLCAAAALLASIGVYALSSAPERWRARTEIAWLGVDAPAPGAAVRLGGDPDGVTIGWPGGHAWPEVRLTSRAGGARLETLGGIGLLEADGKPVNGDPLTPGADLTIDGFRVRAVAPLLRQPRVEVRPAAAWQPPRTSWRERLAVWWAGSDPALAIVELSRPPSGVLTIAPLVARTVMELRRTGTAERLQLALALEEWAAKIAVAFGEDDALRVLVDDPTRTVVAENLPLPLALTIRWPHRVLRAEAWESGQRLHVGFLPPWRVASPLPPRAAGSSDPIPLAITPSPRPGTFVFDLPFGRGVRDVVLSIPIVRHPARGEVFAGAPEPEPRIVLPPGTARVDEARTYFAERVRSTTCVPAEPMHTCIGLVQDLAHPSALLELLAVALGCFLAALAVVAPVLQRVPATAWAIAVLLASAWSLLSIRLLLALRYGMDPTGLDRLSVSGVALASAALVIVPACLAGSVALYRERFAVRTATGTRQRFGLLTAALLGCCVLGMIEARRALRLWPNLMSDFDPGLPAGLLVLILVISGAGLFALIHQLLLEETDQGQWRWTSVLQLPMVWMRRASDMWRQSRDLRQDWRFWIVPGAALALAVAAFGTVLLAVRAAVGDTKLVTEFLLPVIIGTACAIFWIAALQAFRPGTNYRRLPLPRGRDLVAPTIAFIGIPALAPLLFGDSGGLFSMMGLFVPLGVLLAFSRHPRFGFAVLAGCGVMVLALSLAIRQVSNLPGSERGAARVTAYMHGNDVQRMLPLSRLLSNTGEGIPAGALKGALEHPWETRAIVYRAGWTGHGFAAAPNRRSNVPQSVLQYDSTFSFFVAGDFGLLGGFGLFLLYACPLAAVLAASRRRIDAGHALAVVLAAWMLNEAVVHAAVNLGSIPFTGRNLPFLSVNSAADLLRWTVLAWLMLLAMLWRTTGSDFLLSDDPAVIVDDGEPEPAPASVEPLILQVGPEGGPVAGVATMAAPARPAVLMRVRSWLAVPSRTAIAGVSIASAVVVTVAVIVPGVRVLGRHAELGDPFNWTPFFNEVQRYLDDGLLKWDAAAWTLDASPLAARGVRLDGTSLLEQEIARFNALPRRDKAELPDAIAYDLRRVATLAEYDAFLDRLRRQDAARRPPPPALFRVARRSVISDDGSQRTIEYPRVDAGSNTSVSFAAEGSSREIPTVRYRDRHDRDGGVVTGSTLVGPAWVSGRWEAAYHFDRGIPWIETLRNGVEAEWGRRDRANARVRFETLTLDEGLHQAAMKFAAAKGRARHGELLRMGLQATDPYKALPPRVALSIVSLPDGAVLASGGWPRMTAAPGWRSSPEGVLPPASWLHSRAPGPLMYRYSGDRNFDLIEMGSATKPLWAAAALRVHPRLAEQLRTRGPGGRETEIFGIPLASDPSAGWNVPDAPSWVDFPRYLSRSDNRYHLRLGFLALAQAQQGRFADDGASDSEAESLGSRDGEPVPWRRVPHFAGEIGFSARRPGQFQDLNRTPLASAVRQLFGVSIEAGDYSGRRPSLWTLDEADDRYGAAAGTLSSRFLELTPAVAHLSLHDVRSAREYASLLLGGDDNRWSNIDFAAAFGTAITGRPVVAHMVPGETRAWSGRQVFPETATVIRPGLAEAVNGGTATLALRQSGALQWIRQMGVSAYAKSGTLSTDGGRTDTSRLVVALVRWRSASQGQVARGVVLSLVCERAEPGYASLWLGEFIHANRAELTRLLQ